MDGYEVVTSDDCNFGKVVGERGDYVVIEHGTLRKARHLLPRRFVEVREDERRVRATVSKELISSSPKLHDEEVDQREIAEYYGLASGEDQPATQGYGVLDGDDPAISAAQQELRNDVEPADQQRARIREGGGGDYGSPGRPIIPPNAHEVGGREV